MLIRAVIGCPRSTRDAVQIRNAAGFSRDRGVTGCPGRYPRGGSLLLEDPEAVIDDEVGTTVIKLHELFGLADVAVTSRDFESGDVRHPSSESGPGVPTTSTVITHISAAIALTSTELLICVLENAAAYPPIAARANRTMTARAARIERPSRHRRAAAPHGSIPLLRRHLRKSPPQVRPVEARAVAPRQRCHVGSPLDRKQRCHRR